MPTSIILLRNITLLCFQHLSEVFTLLGALHISKFANFCHDLMQKSFVKTTYTQNVLFQTLVFENSNILSFSHSKNERKLCRHLQDS